MLLQLLRDNVDSLAESVGVPSSGVRLIVALLLSCVASPFYTMVKAAHHRDLFSITVGVSLGWFVFDVAIMHSFGASIIVYLSMILFPRHYYREYINDSIIWDASQMILTLKLSGLALSYSDGDKEIPKTLVQHKNQITEVPSLLSFFGYVYFYSGFLAGPVFQYKSYVSWRDAIHLNNIFALVLSVIGFLGSQMLQVQTIDSLAFKSEKSYMEWILSSCFAVMLYRFRFYLAWSIAEWSGSIAGFGFDEETKEWTGLRNANILSVELPTNMRVGINNWNISVASWLNTYIYQRVGLNKAGQPTGLSTMASFVVSALWHGLSPGYYLFFITGGFYIEAAKRIRRVFRPYFHYVDDRKAPPHDIFFHYTDGTSHPLAIVYDIGGIVVTWFFMQYAGVAFEILDIRRCWAIWKEMYFAPHWITFVVLLIFGLLSFKKKSGQNKRKAH